MAKTSVHSRMRAGSRMSGFTCAQVGAYAANALLCVLIALLCAMAMVVLCPSRALAAGATVVADLGLTVYYENNDELVSDMLIDLYRVADISDDGTLTPVEELSSYPVDWNVVDAASAQALASTLEPYLELSSRARTGGLMATDSAFTDANGVAEFPTEGSTLEPGYYLVVAQPYVSNGAFHEPSSLSLPIPYAYESGEVDETPSVTLKLRTMSAVRPLALDVTKVWKDDAEGEARPNEVFVSLLCDGSVYDTVALNEQNGWHHVWSGLNAGHKWAVIENEVPDGYTVAITRDGNYFTVTNTYSEEEPETPPTPEKPRLPQTGLLWWPVLLLLAAGVVLLIVGRLKFRKDSSE